MSVICSRAGANVIRHLLPDVAWDFLVTAERVDQAAQQILEARFDLPRLLSALGSCGFILSARATSCSPSTSWCR